MEKKAAATKKQQTTKKAGKTIRLKPTEVVVASKKVEPIDPKKVHELFGVCGPYDPPPPPAPLVDYTTFWDCGTSISEIRRKHRNLFAAQDWFETVQFAKETDSWKWRQIKLMPFEPGKTFEEQLARKDRGDDLCAAREIVVFLVLQFLATGERLGIDRLRCKDVLHSGKRIIVGPFHEFGLDIGSVSDDWESPFIGLPVIFTPQPRKK